MQDSFKTFVISLVTSVAVLFVLGPVMVKLQTTGLGPAQVRNIPAAPANEVAPATAAPTPSAKLTAPNVEGMSVGDARGRWKALGIVVIEDGQRTVSTEKPGTILEQLPAAGAPLEQKEIRVIVAAPPELVAVPDVVGHPLTDARARLIKAGFEVPTETRENSEQPNDQVLRQEPVAGDHTEKGSIVRLVVANSDDVQVPKLRGVPLSAARKTLKDAGLTVGRVTRREHTEWSGRKVLSQSPAPGTQVTGGTAVDLVIVAPD